MSIEHDVTYSWRSGGATLPPVTRQIVGAVPGGLSTQIPAGGQNVPAAFSLILSKIESIFLTCDQAVTLKAGGVNAVQTVSVTGSPTGGSTVATLGGVTSGAIPYNANATAVQAALVAMSTVGAGGAACTGGPLPGTPVVVTFAGLNAVKPVALLTFTDSYTGGSSPATSAASTVTGVLPDTTKQIVAGMPLVWDSAGYHPQPFAADVTALYLTNNAVAGANINIRTLSSQ